MMFGDLFDGQHFFDLRTPDDPVEFVKVGYGGKAVQFDRPEVFLYFNEADEVEPVE